MNDIKKYILALLEKHTLSIADKNTSLFDAFVSDAHIIESVHTIQQIQQNIMDSWKIKSRVNDIINTQISIPNATVNKPYHAVIDFLKLGMNDLIYTELEGLENHGLMYNNETETITGTPNHSGDYKISMKFRIDGEAENSILNEKTISLVINADPKSLWKNTPSDLDKDDAWRESNYWKPDSVSAFAALGTKHIVVSSKRGRSHANVGSFRDDDFAFKHYDNSAWSIVCVADGAGSSKLSRLGSKIACETAVEYFSTQFSDDSFAACDRLIKERKETGGEEIQKELNLFLYNSLGKAAFFIHKKLQDTTNELNCNIKDLHSTLIFVLFKQYDFGCAILSFSVGDCPIGVVNKTETDVKLMNWLDVGDYGGGTRFITMPEIFSSNKFPTRFGFTLLDDFSYLLLMTDGIYDAKFVVEANLEKLDNWKVFLADLQGSNDDKIKVDFNPHNAEIAHQLSNWMDFWSPGNHDDRTLAIVF